MICEKNPQEGRLVRNHAQSQRCDKDAAGRPDA